VCQVAVLTCQVVAQISINQSKTSKKVEMLFSLLEACYNLSSTPQTYLQHTSHLTESLQDIFKGLFTSVNEAFCGLGIDSGNNNRVRKEVQRLILAGNRTCFASIGLSRNRAIKIRLYKTLIRRQ
jgi:hypothetical protein